MTPNKELLHQLADNMGLTITINEPQPEFKFEDGKVYYVSTGYDWIFKFNKTNSINREIGSYWSHNLTSKHTFTSCGKLCRNSEVKSYRLATPSEIQEAIKHLPDGHEDKPKIATTMEGANEVLDPRFWVGEDGEIAKGKYKNNAKVNSNLPTEHLARKSQAFTDILNLCEYLNGKFEADGYGWIIDRDLGVSEMSHTTLSKVYLFTSEAAAVHALTHFKPIFETFYS